MNKIIFIILISVSVCYSQELNCRVEVNYENLPVNNRELLTDFASVIESYMNTTRFTNDNWDGQKIDCSMSIFFLGAATDIDYTAQIVVVSQRPIYKSTNNSQMVTINDAQWAFQYQRGQALYANQTTFEALSSFLDFYANIIIGFDWDTWEEFGGTKYFQRAQDIVNLGAASSNAQGWQSSSSTYSRWGLVNEIFAEKYSKFRSAIFDYHYGIDIYSQNKILGQQKIVSLINTLYDMWQSEGGLTSVYVKTFFDAKYGEIIEYMKDYQDLTIFDKLKKIDPPHASRYEGVMQ
ncbi:MAG TPA: DUF4835 family protein [Ignavibacteriaceae bacterium]|nr:DUF4835 family protein [Ignavibacteriaceae bacterium]